MYICICVVYIYTYIYTYIHIHIHIKTDNIYLSIYLSIYRYLSRTHNLGIGRNGAMQEDRSEARVHKR